jgi:hypothetical protein
LRFENKQPARLGEKKKEEVLVAESLEKGPAQRNLKRKLYQEFSQTSYVKN